MYSKLCNNKKQLYIPLLCNRFNSTFKKKKKSTWNEIIIFNFIGKKNLIWISISSAHLFFFWVQRFLLLNSVTQKYIIVAKPQSYFFLLEIKRGPTLSKLWPVYWVLYYGVQRYDVIEIYDLFQDAYSHRTDCKVKVCKPIQNM